MSRVPPPTATRSTNPVPADLVPAHPCITRGGYRYRGGAVCRDQRPRPGTLRGELLCEAGDADVGDLGGAGERHASANFGVSPTNGSTPDARRRAARWGDPPDSPDGPRGRREPVGRFHHRIQTVLLVLEDPSRAVHSSSPAHAGVEEPQEPVHRFPCLSNGVYVLDGGVA